MKKRGIQLVPSTPPPALDNSSPVVQMDGMQNLVTGMGGRFDKQSYSRFHGLDIPYRRELEAMYRTDWVAAKAIDAPISDMLREWRGWENLDAATIKKIAKEEKRLKYKHTVKTVKSWSQLYGGALVLAITEKNTNPMAPLVPGDGQKVARFHVFDRYEVSAHERLSRDPFDVNFGLPEFYMIGNKMIHHTRLHRVNGRELPRRMHHHINDGWGDSALVKIYSAVLNARTIYDSVASLVHEANVDYFRVDGLMNMMGDCDQEQNVLKRLQLLKLTKSIHHLALLDTEETLENKQINFSAFGSILYDYITAVAGAVDIPLTRFLGVSPGGLDSAGESDLNNYYDRLKSEQEAELNPIMDWMDSLMLPDILTDGEMEEAEYEHNPLRQETKKEKADTEAVDATIDTAYAEIVPESVRLRRLQKTGRYDITDEYIAEIEAIEAEEDNDDDLDDEEAALKKLLEEGKDPDDKDDEGDDD